ncbi:hypothetical protein N657DRAFT_584553 [Parathielavia appendiculata]|uniref:Uncharacterized protein n=1 Tax=Parathielavia appendiculata TaxID=2587402 RepID=A0AAN6TNU0_9PEZI|nr:hypothetical protein N657DRAFT_584553 [Parathielavia appendiculata]
MVMFNDIFTPLPALRTAVCHDHGSVATARSVASHVNLQHRHLAVQARRRIVEEALVLRDDGLLAADPNGVRFPDEVVPAIDGLPVWNDGKKCMECGYIRRTRNHIQQHCRSEHGWVNPRGRGRRGPASAEAISRNFKKISGFYFPR